MHYDLDQSDLASQMTSICIIGAGAAGITLTRRLLKAGQTVTLLESGGVDYEEITAELNAGGSVGEEYYDLKHARLRFFGGTTAIWGGRVAELDPIDFQGRDWVPHSGWPITHEEIAPYYAEARRLFGVRPDSEPPSFWLPEFDPDILALKQWSFDDQVDRFTYSACRDLIDHPRCTIITHATATRIAVEPNGRKVRSVTVRGMSGRSLVVHARTFVLAAGGIENPRLLLTSRDTMPRGLGNEHDLVGRFFMEHPHARGGRLVTNRTWQYLDAFGRPHTVRGRRVAALITPSPARQAKASILNTSLTIVPRQPAGRAQFWGMRAYGLLKHNLAPTNGTRKLWLRAKRMAARLQRVADPLRPWLLHKLDRVELALLVRAEQAPNPDSRIMLSEKTDVFGVPQVKLDWRTSDLDIRSVARLVADLGHEMERLGHGRAEPARWLAEGDRRWSTDPLVSAHPIGGYHHMGTTRMADEPKRGVTDRNGRVHGLANLYIAGSSLFPTSGWANPTLTIAALSLRTADHIVGQMGKAGALPETRVGSRGR